MKKAKIQYQEIFHHDFPLIIAELTDYGESLKNFPWSKEEFKFDPYCVYERKDNQLYYFYDSKGIAWKTEQGGKFDKEIMKKKSLDGYNEIKDILLNEKALDKKEFEIFLNKVKKLWTWWECMWFIIEYYDQHKLPLDDLMAVRKETEYMAPGIQGTIRHSIERILPDKKEYKDVLLINEVLNNKVPSENILKERLKGCAYTNSKLYNSIQEVEKEYNIEIEKEKINKDIKELKGQIAYKGKVSGTVNIIKQKSDMKKFKQGQVLVASTTTPDFLPAMKKASAFISEHGGMICHASITSRELKTPCIVGVKNATKILKNGDKVEVDANKGIIRISNKV